MVLNGDTTLLCRGDLILDKIWLRQKLRYNITRGYNNRKNQKLIFSYRSLVVVAEPIPASVIAEAPTEWLNYDRQYFIDHRSTMYSTLVAGLLKLAHCKRIVAQLASCLQVQKQEDKQKAVNCIVTNYSNPPGTNYC